MVQEYKGIGILGGVGSYAGCVLHQHILKEMESIFHPQRDQDYLPVFHLAWPSVVTNRTEFLLGREAFNPAFGALEVMKLFQTLAEQLNEHLVVGIPCNTFHAKPIFDVFQSHLACPNLKVLHLIKACQEQLQNQQFKSVGVLSTTGTRYAKIYPSFLEPKGIQVLISSESMQKKLHQAIYHPEWGIKSSGHQFNKIREIVEEACNELASKGAQSIVLGCTELPLVMKESTWHTLPVIDPMRALAHALVKPFEFQLQQHSKPKP